MTNPIKIEDILENVKHLTKKHDFSTDVFQRLEFLESEFFELDNTIWNISKESDNLDNISDADKQLIGEEIQDVIWNACAVGLSLGIDVEKYIKTKMERNLTRDFGKGNEKDSSSCGSADTFD